MTEWITDATVEIKGNDRNGTPISLTGDIDDVAVEAYQRSALRRGDLTLAGGSDYYLKFRAKSNGEQYRVQLGTREVKHTSEIEIPGCTPANIERARVAVGAPEDAGVTFIKQGYWAEAVEIDLATQKTKLAFVWTEKKVIR